MSKFLGGLAQPYSNTTQDAPPVAVSRVGCWGLAHAFLMHKRRVPSPSRVLCERAGLLEAVCRERLAHATFPFLGRRTEEYGLSDRQSTDASDRAVDSRGVLVRMNHRLHHFWRRTG